jgi:hypothetical protein
MVLGFFVSIQFFSELQLTNANHIAILRADRQPDLNFFADVVAVRQSGLQAWDSRTGRGGRGFFKHQ